MPPNPTCTSDTVIVSGCSVAVPRLLYVKVTDVSGCSQFDGKVVQILHDSASGNWLSDDAGLDFTYSITSFDSTMRAKCVGDMLGWIQTNSGGGCPDPVDDTYSGCLLQCCGEVDLKVVEFA